MKLQKLTTLLCVLGLTLVLSGCGKEEVTEEIVKQPYYLTVQPLTKSDQAGTITKNAKVIGTSEIVITSQVAGRINSINTNLGSSVSNGQSVVQLTDTVGSIRFGLEKTQLAARSAQDSYAIQKANLEKQIADAQLALERSKLNLTTTVTDNAQQLEKINYDLDNVDADTQGSSTQLQLQKLQKDLEKAQFDYQTKLDADSQAIENFIRTAQNIGTDITNLSSDVITESDKFLGISNEFRSFNDDYEVYIGAKDFASKAIAENTLLKLQGLQDELKALNDIVITQENITSYLQSYRTIITAINELTIAMKTVLIATVPSTSLSQIALDGLNAQFNGLNARASGITSSITAQVNGIESFVSTYKQSQQSLAKQIEIFKDQIALTQKGLNDAEFTTNIGADRTRIALDAGLQNAQLTVEGTQIATDFVTNTKDLNLQTIQNQLESAQVSLRELEFNASKYTVRSPIRGIVSDVLVDIGQEVTPGTPLVRVVSNTQQLEISMTESQLQYIQQGQEVTVSNEYQTGSAVVENVARVADKDGSYKVVISMNTDVFSVGSFVDVQIPLYKGDIMIPLNAVSIVDTNLGQINLWDGNAIVNKTVKLGAIYGNNITIIESIPAGMMLITSDIDNYDENKYILETKSAEAQ